MTHFPRHRSSTTNEQYPNKKEYWLFMQGHAVCLPTTICPDGLKTISNENGNLNGEHTDCFLAILGCRKRTKHIVAFMWSHRTCHFNWWINEILVIHQQKEHWASDKTDSLIQKGKCIWKKHVFYSWNIFLLSAVSCFHANFPVEYDKQKIQDEI